ncbi:MAG: succinylglutamate desuccinylase/aspartoacylase family protein [Spirochaetales bacterium]|nr:succinylglutamate desuccinylase/aspartoacylase family protein [Spirochaetales bacterium]
MVKRLFLIMIVIFCILGGCYSCAGSEGREETFILCEGLDVETTGFIIDSGQPGPVVYIVGGIHGNEPAGIAAASAFSEYALKKGRVIVLPRANIEAVKAGERSVYWLGDLNRAFPGKERGLEVQELAYEIFTHIADQKPDIVLDLHESRQRDPMKNYALGNSIIFSHPEALEPVMDSVDFLNRHRGNLTPFVYQIDSIPGTLNQSVTEILDIPVITLETDVEAAFESRVKDQKSFLDFMISEWCSFFPSD